ncbi:hypothetical protein D3C73_973780 [compost metagenome]
MELPLARGFCCLRHGGGTQVGLWRGGAASRGRHAPHQRLQRGGDFRRGHVVLKAGVGAAMQAKNAVFGRIKVGHGDDARSRVHGAQTCDGHAEIGEFGLHHKQWRAARLEQAKQAIGVLAPAWRESHLGQCVAAAHALVGIGREDDQV